ncbi:MAG: DUF4907 domain-containing protein [Bacteroidota bacterium]
MKRSVLIIILSMMINGLINPLKAQQKPPVNNNTYSFTTIPSEANTWGYTIVKNGKTIIKQTTVPSQPGTKGFKKKEDAGKVAALVIKKLKTKNDLPTISKEELIQLHIQL